MKRNVVLGLETTTDVFEIQPRHTLPRAAANALIIAFREALAQELGIEADEMGFAVEQTQNALGAPAVLLFLFDKATGGAGFATSFEHSIKNVLCRAEKILDCTTPGCDKGCATCVLISDAPSGKDELDRTAALSFLRTHLKLQDELDPEDHFAQDSSLSLNSVDEIDRELRRSARSFLTVFLPQHTSPEALMNWPLAAELLDWKKRGHSPRLAFAQGVLESMSSAEKLFFRDFALQHNVSIIAADAPGFANGSYAIAMVHKEGQGSSLWVTREGESRLPGPTWGWPNRHPIARGTVSISVPHAMIDADSLLPPPGAQLVQIDTELNCDLVTFGVRASATITELLRKCGAWSKSPITKAFYRDPYVSSPLVTRLLIDTIKQVFTQSGTEDALLVIETRAPRPNDLRGLPWQVWHDWRDIKDQKAVAESLGKQRGVRVALFHKDVAHGRYLDIEFADGGAATIVLDQGFGAWAPDRELMVRYNFAADYLTQVRRLATVNVLLERQGVGKTYMIATRST